ncbi:MAG: ATP-dependent zinc metalloprotease FtsH [Chloroflexi bacterium]|nr:ATP-dependent zinc metalloprotease FtsH [Chloroflexota bacterium]
MKKSRISRIRWMLIGGSMLILLLMIIPRGQSVRELEISQVLEMAEAGQLDTIEVTGDKLAVTTVDGNQFKSRKEPSVSILELLQSRGVTVGPGTVEVEIKQDGGGFLPAVLSFLPLILIGALVFYMMRRSQGGISQALNIGKSRARAIGENKPSVTFDDVAGADEAKQELVEIVEFLNNPTKFTRLGAKIPRGVLLTGPPGTGKTLISRAVAGEAGVPFFSTSGSEFVEMFVGVGASRVRDLFNKAKENAPALIFIDEIDAVGRHRGAGIGGGNDEREQTLNQILVEMDGFDERTNVIVIAATNRPDILDPALVRPGRFDRHVTLDSPDVRGREAILRVHLGGMPVVDGLDLGTVARETPGFSGADLANLVNEAAILAARADKHEIEFDDFEEAIDRVIAGPARRSRKTSEREREVVAYHEAGHALVAATLPQADPVHKVTIVSRGASGGHTRLLPTEDRGLWTKGQFEAMLAVMMGGQAAEQEVFGDVTTGASNDLQNATNLARRMVTEYGMSEELGPQSFSSGQSETFLGRELGSARRYSDAIAAKIDAEVGKLLTTARATAGRIISENCERLAGVARKLVSDETIQGADLQKMLQLPSEDAPVAA